MALFGVAHFVAGPFLCGPFWHEFHENNFLLYSFSNFLIYINFFVFLFSFFKIVEVFLFILISFHYIKIQVQTHRYCFFIRLFQ